jgi:hypothetical protein
MIGQILLKKYVNGKYNLCRTKILSGVILELHDFIFTNLIKFTAKDETKLQQKILNINLRNEFEATEFGMDLRLKDCKFKNSIHQFQQINNYNTPFQKLVIFKC